MNDSNHLKHEFTNLLVIITTLHFYFLDEILNHQLLNLLIFC